MHQVETFHSERDLNEWLERYYDQYEIVDIKFQCSNGKVFMVHYKI